MSAGRLIAVVGASGVGKDSVIDGICAARADIVRVRRVITRAAEAGGEAYDAVTPEQFDAMAQSGAFALHWRAHGLDYGLPVGMLAHLDAGRDCLANLSRAVLTEAATMTEGVAADLVVLNITAAPQTLARRLAARGRESADEIAARLAQQAKLLPAGLPTFDLSNDGPLTATVVRALAHLDSTAGTRRPAPAPPPLKAAQHAAPKPERTP